MAIDLTSGTRLRSSVCDAEVVIVKTPGGEVDLRCGGHPMVPVDASPSEDLQAAPGFDEGVLIGKRYTDEAGELEVLCTKAGSSSLSIGDRVLMTKDAKPLPSSD